MKLIETTLLTVLAVACASDLYANEGRTIPAQFHGTWTWNKSGAHPEDGEQPLRISPREIAAHETSGQVKRVTLSSSGGKTCVVSVSAACEGMEGNETLTLKLSPDGKRLTLQQDKTNVCGFLAGVYHKVGSSSSNTSAPDTKQTRLRYQPAVVRLTGSLIREENSFKGLPVESIILVLDEPVDIVSDQIVREFPSVAMDNVAQIEVSSDGPESVVNRIKALAGSRITLEGSLTHQISNWQFREVLITPRKIVD